MSRSKLQDKKTKVTFTVKIDSELNERFKNLRKAMDKKGLTYNASNAVSNFLLREIKAIEKEMELL